MNQLISKKILLSAAIVVVAVLSATQLLDRALNSIPGAQAMGETRTQYLDEWTTKSLATFAITKSINAGLSVVEDSELQLAALNIAAGEVVRPLNEMIAKVSSVALASAVSLGIQRMLIEIGAWVGLTWFLTASMICWLVVIWVDSSTMRRLAYGLFVLALVARFLIPAAVLATGYVGERYMEGVYVEAQSELKLLEAEARQASGLVALDAEAKGAKGTETAADSSGDTSFLGRAKDLGVRLRDTVVGAKDAVVGAGEAVAGAGEAVAGAKERILGLISRLSSQADVYSEVAVNYIVVFIVQTMLMPILILWALVKLLGYLLNPAAAAGIEARWLAPIRAGGESREKSPQAPEAVTEAQG